jgi:putative phosphoesterase
VLEELGQVAPVYAVRGNRDIFYLRKLPMQIQLNIDGVSIGLAHGHGTFSRYMIDKFHMAMPRELEKRHTRRMLQTFPDADVIVFGHLHFPCNFHLEGKLIFNPGSASFPLPRGQPATLGFLHLDIPGEPRGEIIRLDQK